VAVTSDLGSGDVPVDAHADPTLPTVRTVLVPSNIWRIGLTLAGLTALVLFARFVLADGGSVIFTVIMAWFLSLAMEPAVAKLSSRMPRAVATGVVMVSGAVAAVAFLLAFGNLFFEQAAQLLRGIPDMVETVLEWSNRTFGTNYAADDLLAAIKLTPEEAAAYAQDVLGGVIGLVGSVAGAVFSSFAIVLLTFYLSADGPRLRLWLASLLPPSPQRLFLSVWDLSLVKTGGYVAARLVLAAINGGTSAIVFLIIGMPGWLALGIWTGLVAQFVPTIGTYIAIALPVLVGLASPNPWVGVAALIWAVIYQQVENLTLEPRISARAVHLHPGVAFASVMLGASLFGAGGALLAIPVVAMLMAVFDSYVERRHVVPALVPGEVVDDPEGIHHEAHEARGGEEDLAPGNGTRAPGKGARTARPGPGGEASSPAG
jgi:predicted PurR-regulated permease PerM